MADYNRQEMKTVLGSLGTRIFFLSMTKFGCHRQVLWTAMVSSGSRSTPQFEPNGRGKIKIRRPSFPAADWSTTVGSCEHSSGCKDWKDPTSSGLNLGRTQTAVSEQQSVKSFQSAGFPMRISRHRCQIRSLLLMAATIRDESLSKQEDEFSLSEGFNSWKAELKSSHFNFENVRFSPKVIEFIDAFEGKQFAVKITIQNVGRNPVWVKIGEPSSFIFQLKKPSRRVKFLAAGASITKTISYTYHKIDLVQKSQIPVQINGNVVDYPIVVKKAVPDIEIQPQKLDFKVINLGASAKTMILTIFNTGGKRTKFKVDVGKNILDLVVTPMGGTIKAKSQVSVRVEMMGLSEGEYYHELWIKTNELPIRVPVMVKVVRPRLEIVFPNGTEDFTLITFPPTFNGSQRAQPFVLKNCSTDTTLFSTLAEVNGELQILPDARKTVPFNMFLLTAEEGRLEPFESRVCSVLFRPKAMVRKKNWHHKEEQEKGKNYMEHIIFLRINRVQRIERREIENDAPQHKVRTKTKQILNFESQREDQVADRRRNYFAASSVVEEKVLRLCLHGNAVAPDFLIQPFSFEFGDLYLGQTSNKVLRVTNNTTIPAECRLSKVLNVRTTPTKAWLKSEEAHEFCISLTPRSAGRFKSKMIVQILAHSDVVFDSDKTWEVVAEYSVVLNFNAIDIFKIPKPKVGLGITPLITDEVGLQKDSITFKDVDKIPFAAALKLKQGFQTAWMKKEEDKLNNVDNAIVALPNDRPRMFYTWPKEKICRTIFSGFFRYAPPEDVTYTLSAHERNRKKEHMGIWTNYLTFLRELRKAKYPNLHELTCCLEYNLSCKKHYSTKQIKIDSEFQSTAQRSIARKGCAKEPKFLLDHACIPLSPMFLSRVTIEPKFINFDQVAVNSIAQKTIIINNMNDFSISIKFVSGKSAVSVMESDAIIVEPSATKHILILFQTKDLGRYFGFLNYVINGSHEFKITISALVMPKTLSLGDPPVNVHFGMCDPKEAFQPRSMFLPLKNLLQSPIRYRWEISPDSAFSINVTDGEVPPRSTIFAEVLFDMCPRKSFYSEMTLFSESGNTEEIKLIYMGKKVAVKFLSNRVDMHDIPLNLPTKVKAVIQNACYHEVPFEVIDANPLPGITIEPKEGVIKARSLFPLEINVQIPVIMKFNFKVVLMVHFINRISVKVTGNVVPPDVRLKPSEVVMRKICAQAVDTFAIRVENVGTTPAEVFVDFKNCPEYRVLDNNHKLYLLPKHSSRFRIQFEPTDVSRYMFYLPVTINGILGPPEMQEPATEDISFFIKQYESMYEAHGDVFFSERSGLKIPCVCLNSTVTPRLLSISPLTVNFTLQYKSFLKCENIVVTNECGDAITFCIRNDDLGESNDSPFDLIPITTDSVENRRKSMKIHLGKGEKIVFRVSFEPTKPGLYSIDVPVFVRGYSNGLVYNFLHLKGELKSPTIVPEASEVHFPPLPLDVDCDVSLMICAENYSTAETLSCMVYDPQEENEGSLSQYIKTKWLTEPIVLPYQKASSFQLQINFHSCIPVAVKNYILLFDSAGTYSSIFVTAIADNSAVTAHAFLSTRSTKYKIVRDNPPQIWERPGIPSFPIIRSELKMPEKNLKEKKALTSSYSENLGLADSTGALQIDKGPKLIVQESKSSSKYTQLGFVNVSKRLLNCETSSSTFLYITKSKIMHSFISKNESITSSKIYPNTSLVRRTEVMNDVSYPNFPIQESPYKTHFEETLRYVERWMFEVVMRCDRHFSIPLSFQRLTGRIKPPKQSEKDKVPESEREKDFLDFLREIAGPDPAIPEWKISAADQYPETRALKLQSVYSDILQFLENKGCLVPHVRPEFLMDYKHYVLYANEIKSMETFSWKGTVIEKMKSLKIMQDTGPARLKPEKETVPYESSSLFSPAESWKKSLFEGFIMPGSEDDIEKVEERDLDTKETFKEELKPMRESLKRKRFFNEEEVLDELNFDLRATQAWLDIVVQIFRVFIMKRIVPKNTIPRVTVVGINDKIPVETTFRYHDANSSTARNSGPQPIFFEDSHASNVYTLQERILIDWLNHHCQIQQRILWGQKSKSESPPAKKIINNFDKDLSDSIALISVTASHCPYIVSDYFDDVFSKPDTLTKSYHNAGKLILAWRTLEIGLTVETADIVQPNPVFMVMLVAQLYEVLPSLHPHSLICFSAPLIKETTRVIQLKNDLDEGIYYKAKFFGEHEGLFHLRNSNLIDAKPLKTVEVRLTFSARKINRVSATLILIGSCISPRFGKHLAFYLEGEPSELSESDKYSFTAPLYKMICTSIPVKPPFTVPATYEVWYTTKKPEYSESADISTVVKPWSLIWNRKVSRRLFLNQSEVKFDGIHEPNLSVTIACLTEKSRNFWLLLRSKICDFIILVEIKTRVLEVQTPITGFYSQSWSPSATCLCSNGKQLPKPNSISPSSCPLLTEVNIPTRNDKLWSALWAMFLKTLQPHEKSFWNEHFEMDIGMCLILWLLSPEEEEDVIDEFIQVLLTRVTYKLKVEPPNDSMVIIPRSIEIMDVRKTSEIVLPIHLSNSAPSTLLFNLIMTSENGKEIRNLTIKLTPCGVRALTTKASPESSEVQVVPSIPLYTCKKQT